jgi:hypothetical protein
MKPLFAVALLLTLTTLPATTRAAENNSTPPMGARDCPAIFGLANTPEAVLSRRQSAVEGIVEDRYGVVLFHHVGRWSSPTVTNLAGVTLLEVDRDARTLTFDVTAELEGCPKGRYLVDDAVALGRDGVVIATLADGVLVEKQRALHYMPTQGRSAPRFRVVWRSPYSIVRDAPTGGAPVTAGGKRPTPTAAMPPVPAGKPEALKAASARRESARAKK